MSEVAHAGLQIPWVVGLALLLAGMSVRSYLPTLGSHKGAGSLRRASSRLADVGILLLFVGLALASPEWWHRILSAAGAVVYVVDVVRRTRQHTAPEEAHAREAD